MSQTTPTTPIPDPSCGCGRLAAFGAEDGDYCHACWLVRWAERQR